MAQEGGGGVFLIEEDCGGFIESWGDGYTVWTSNPDEALRFVDLDYALDVADFLRDEHGAECSVREIGCIGEAHDGC